MAGYERQKRTSQSDGQKQSSFPDTAPWAKADLILFRDALVEMRDKIAALKKEGRSLPDVIAAKPGTRYDAV